MGWAFKSKHNTIIFTEELMSFFESKRNQREGEKSTKTADAEVKKKKKLYATPEESFSNRNIGQFFVADIYILLVYTSKFFCSRLKAQSYLVRK